MIYYDQGITRHDFMAGMAIGLILISIGMLGLVILEEQTQAACERAVMEQPNPTAQELRSCDAPKL